MREANAGILGRNLRGPINARELLAVIGAVRGAGRKALGAGALRSPGLLRKHYAPKARLMVLSWRDDPGLRRQISDLKFRISDCFIIAHTRIPSASGWGRVSVLPRAPEAFASALYAELHRCDEGGAGWIVVEALPDAPEWNAVADRLRRAAAI